MASSNGMPSAKEAEILELLFHGGKMYGLEMVKASKGALKRGTIYVLLDRLEDQGLIESEVGVADASGSKRRWYRIKGLGQKSLQAYRAVRSVWADSAVPAGA